MKMAVLVILIASPVLSFSQYFQQLYDIDSADNWGWDVFLRSDSNYFVEGWSFNQYTGIFSIYDMIISSDGKVVLSKHKQIPNSPSNSIINGGPGEIKPLLNGNGYVIPYTIQWPNASTHYLYSAAGIEKINSLGDSIFMKTYTDTSIYFEAMNAVTIMPDGGYALGGEKGFDTPSMYLPAYIIRTDSIGDTIWTHTYQKFPTQAANVANVIALNDGRIAVYAMSTYQANPGTADEYTHNSPWFLLLDSTGSVLRDTLYSTGYVSGNIGVYGDMYADKNGGYIVIGGSDSMYNTSSPGDARNFPGYIAHLDTNFRMTWRTSFPFSDELGHRQGAVVRQLNDGGYIVIGDSWTNSSYDKGFAAKIDRSGRIVWSHNYYSDATHNAYLRDVVERPDGGFVMTGGTFNDTLPAWHQFQDMWLVAIDSNGCEDGLCAPAAVPAAPQPVVKNNEVLVYPNPTSSTINFEFPASGVVTIKLMDLTGRVLREQVISNHTTAAFDVKGYATGLYLYQVITDGKIHTGKFIVQ